MREFYNLHRKIVNLSFVNFQFHEYILNKKENIRKKEWYIYEKKYL